MKLCTDPGCGHPESAHGITARYPQCSVRISSSAHMQRYCTCPRFRD